MTFNQNRTGYKTRSRQKECAHQHLLNFQSGVKERKQTNKSSYSALWEHFVAQIH